MPAAQARPEHAGAGPWRRTTGSARALERCCHVQCWPAHPSSISFLACCSISTTRGLLAHLEKSPEGSLVKVCRGKVQRKGGERLRAGFPMPACQPCCLPDLSRQGQQGRATMARLPCGLPPRKSPTWTMRRSTRFSRKGAMFFWASYSDSSTCRLAGAGAGGDEALAAVLQGTSWSIG